MLSGIDRFRRAAQAALDLGMASRPKASLSLTVESLLDLFEATSGVKATHTTKEAGDYTGTPRTFAGRFVTAVFERIDPKIEPRTIANLLEKLVWKGKS